MRFSVTCNLVIPVMVSLEAETELDAIASLDAMSRRELLAEAFPDDATIEDRSIWAEAAE